MTDNACVACYGAGGDSEREWQGDGAWRMWVWFFNECDFCLGGKLCPGCMRPINVDPFNIDALQCSFEDCGWYYDVEREYSDDEDGFF